MSCRKKAAAQVILLAAGAAMLCFGVWRVIMSVRAIFMRAADSR